VSQVNASHYTYLVLQLARRASFRTNTIVSDPASNFFDHFTYFNEPDPTHGFVQYQSVSDSMRQNLTTYRYLSSPLVNNFNHPNSDTTPVQPRTAVLRVDSTTFNTTQGRPSARIISKSTYTTGLFLFSIVHTPYGCGTWPALWLLGPSWPTGGEIDVVEAVNMGDSGNHVTLHTSEGCRIGTERKRKQTGTAKTWDCWNATNWNSGCGVLGGWGTYGAAFNKRGGGVYALEVRKEGIRVWVFMRNYVPGDVVDGRRPDPSRWGTPLADFPNLECNIERYFRDMQIVVNIALCGDWAGQPHVFGDNDVCEGGCTDWVSLTSESFREAYSEFDGFRVYAAQK
jgi:hypothetical protein